MLTSMLKIWLVGYYLYICAPSYVGVCLFVCLFVCFEFFDKRFLFFFCSKRKEILSNFLFSVFLFVLFLMMANNFFS